MTDTSFGSWNLIKNRETGEEIESSELLFYPNGFDDYVKALQQLMKIDSIEEKLEVHPIVVSMYLANTCRDNCMGCFAKKAYVLDESRRKETTRTKKDIVDELISYGMMDFKFSGGGDPLMGSELVDVLQFVHEKGARSIIITNGDNIGPNLEALAYYLTHFRFSANANNNELHKRMNRPCPAADDFDTRIKNISKLVGLRKEAGLVSGTTYLTNKAVEGSVEGLEEYMKMAIDIGFDYISPRLVGGIKPYRRLLERLETIKSNGSNGVNIILNPESDYPIKEDALLFLKLTIDYEHRVYPCPRGVYSYRFVYGDLDKESFIDIWSSEKRASFVRTHAPFPSEADSMCKRCNYILNGRSPVYNWMMEQMNGKFDFQLLNQNEI